MWCCPKRWHRQQGPGVAFLSAFQGGGGEDLERGCVDVEDLVALARHLVGLPECLFVTLCSEYSDADVAKMANACVTAGSTQLSEELLLRWSRSPFSRTCSEEAARG